MKPRVFRWIDALTFGLAAVLAVVLSLWATLTPQAPGTGAGPMIILWAVAAGFIGCYGMILLNRWKMVRAVTFVTKHGLVCFCNGYPVDALELEVLTDFVLEKWDSVVLAGSVPPPPAKAGLVKPPIKPADVREHLKGLFVLWKTYPFVLNEKAERPFHYTGLASNVSHMIMVGYRDPLVNTAFGHELGHVILRFLRNDTSEEGLLKLNKDYGVPY